MKLRVLAFMAVLAIAALVGALALWPTAHDSGEALAQAAEPPPVRDVTPVGVTPGPAVSGPLERIVPPAPPPPPPKPPEWRRFFKPVATAAGAFQFGNIAVHVAGVRAPEADRQCNDGKGGADWPCGRLALTAFRQMLMGRAVECYWPGDPTPPEATDCRVGATNLALWLAANGWAEAADDAPDAVRQAFGKARCNRLGLWRDLNEAGCPVEATTASRN